MNALTLTVLFLVGLVIGVIFPKPERPTSQVRSRRYNSRGDRLDDIDEMFLWGEVTGDDFYR